MRDNALMVHTWTECAFRNSFCQLGWHHLEGDLLGRLTRNRQMLRRHHSERVSITLIWECLPHFNIFPPRSPELKLCMLVMIFRSSGSPLKSALKSQDTADFVVEVILSSGFWLGSPTTAYWMCWGPVL